jgi:hypothetical protein
VSSRFDTGRCHADHQPQTKEPIMTNVERIDVRTVYVTADDLYEAARELTPECPVTWTAEDGTTVIFRAAWGEDYDAETD